MDTADEDFGLDAYFSLDINEGCHESFFFFDVPVEPEKAVQAQLNEHQRKLFKPGATVERFTRWGAYTGKGVILRGKMKPLGTGTLRIFAYATARRALHLI